MKSLVVMELKKIKKFHIFVITHKMMCDLQSINKAVDLIWIILKSKRKKKLIFN